MKRLVWIIIAAALVLGVTYCARKDDRPVTEEGLKRTDRSKAQSNRAAPEKEENEVEDRETLRPVEPIQYSRPQRDPAIILRPGADGVYEIVDTKTGDFFRIQTADREEQLLYFSFWTKDDKYVCTFRVKFGLGIYGKEEPSPYPVRVYGTRDARDPVQSVTAARERMSIERFSQFLEVLPEFQSQSKKNFVVIDDPILPGEPL